MIPGTLNLITDVPGLRVGNAEDHIVKTGVTVLTADKPLVTGLHVMGGAPGTRETDALAPDKLVQEADALVLSGGSALGLSAASGVADALRASGRGFDVAGQKVPIVPAAILFDLLNGGAKDWDVNPYADLGATALNAAATSFQIGTAGAGTGATTANLKGGIGSASIQLENGMTVGALVAVNALGSATVGETPNFWAAPFEEGREFGGLGPSQTFPRGFETKLASHREATTIAIVATDAVLTQAQATRMAIAAHDGMARALVPSHTPMDGDLVFAAATGEKPLADPLGDALILGHAAATCLARAIARGVYAASPSDGDLVPCWRSLDR